MRLANQLQGAVRQHRDRPARRNGRGRRRFADQAGPGNGIAGAQIVAVIEVMRQDGMPGTADRLAETYAFASRLECFQAVYTSGRRFAENSVLDIRQLDVGHLDTIYAYYHDYVEYEYLRRRLASGAIYGGFLGETLCGFIGTHEEGSIGILEVLDEYRGHGFGSALEKFMVDLILDRDEIPFAQLSVDNQISLALHRKLGFEISTDRLYWLF